MPEHTKHINGIAMSTSKNENSEKTEDKAPSFTVFGFPTAELFPLAPERTSSCVLCHHMHEKGAIKEHISFIPGNFPNP